MNGNVEPRAHTTWTAPTPASDVAVSTPAAVDAAAVAVIDDTVDGTPARRVLGAIWSLCVSNGDLVTEVLDIENVSDQIDPSAQPAARLR